MVSRLEPNEKVLMFAADLNSRLWSPSNNGESTRDTVSHRLDVVLERCGYAKRSKARLEFIQRLLTSMGIIPIPSLTTEGLERDERIRFGRSEPPLVGHQFNDEKALQRFIKENVERLEQFGGYSLLRTEYILKNGDRIDVLLENATKKTWLVVELEKEQKDESPVQLLRYMNELRERSLPAGYGIEGMIISGRPRPEQIQVFNTTSYPGPAQWIVYTVTLNLAPAEGSVRGEPTVQPLGEIGTD